MTSGVRDRLESRVASIREKQRREWLRDLHASKNTEEMVSRITSSGKGSGRPATAGMNLWRNASRWRLKTSRATPPELSEQEGLLRGQAGGPKALNAAAGSQPLGTGSFEIRHEKDAMDKLEKRHLADCRRTSRAAQHEDRRDVAECRKGWTRFLSYGPTLPGKTVAKVRDFLNVIQGGIKGKLNVVRDFQRYQRQVF